MPSARPRTPTRSIALLCWTTFAAALSLGACTADTSDLDPDDAGTGSSGRPGPASSSGAVASSSGTSASSSTGGQQGTSSGDPGSSSGEPTDPGSSSGDPGSSSGDIGPAPEPGTACSYGERYERECGTCGTQLAFCTQQGIVSGYGRCNQPAVCPDNNSSSSGDPGSSSGDPGSSSGNVNPNPVLPRLVVPGAVNETATVAMPDSAGQIGRPAASAGTHDCPLTIANVNGHHAYVEVHNPHNEPAKVELRHVHDASVDTYMAAYSALPVSDADRQACVGKFNQACGGGTGAACLAGAGAVTIPAQSTYYIYIGEYSPDRAWDPTSQLEAKLIALGDAGPAPANGPRIELPAALNQDVSVAVPESLGKISKPSGLSGTRSCPLTLVNSNTEHAYVEVHNPNDRPAKVALRHTIGAGNADAFMVAYSAMPASDADRLACVGKYNQACASGSGPACLVGTNAVEIPAQSTYYIYLGMWSTTAAWNDSSQLQATILSWADEQPPPPPPVPILTLPAALNENARVALPQSAGKIAKPNGGVGAHNCPLTLSQTETEHVYVEVRNPNAQAARVELEHEYDNTVDTYMAVYEALPASDAARLACVGKYDQASCADYGENLGPACLIGANAVTIPAQSSRFVYIGEWNANRDWDPTSELRARILGWQ